MDPVLGSAEPLSPDRRWSEHPHAVHDSVSVAAIDPQQDTRRPTLQPRLLLCLHGLGTNAGQGFKPCKKRKKNGRAAHAPISLSQASSSMIRSISGIAVTSTNASTAT